MMSQTITNHAQIATFNHQIGQLNSSFKVVGHAIQQLQECGLALQLEGTTLEKLCAHLGITTDSNIAQIHKLLFVYYYDEKNGCDRSDTDRIVITNFTGFNPGALCAYLSTFLGDEKFLRIEGQDDVFHPHSAILFKRFDGKQILKSCASAAAILDVFNTEAEDCGLAYRFRRLDFEHCLMAYALTNDVFIQLLSSGAVPFSE